MSCLVFLPRDRYTTAVRLEIARILKEAYGGSTVDYTALVTESVLARLHFVVRVAHGEHLPEVDPDELEARLVAATRSWSDDFHDALRATVGEEAAVPLARRWADAFPEGYKEDFTSADAVERRPGGRGARRRTPDGARPLRAAGSRPGRAPLQGLHARRRAVAVRGPPGAAAHGRRGHRRAAVRLRADGRRGRAPLRLRAALRPREVRHRTPWRHARRPPPRAATSTCACSSRTRSVRCGTAAQSPTG